MSICSGAAKRWALFCNIHKGLLFGIGFRLLLMNITLRFQQSFVADWIKRPDILPKALLYRHQSIVITVYHYYLTGQLVVLPPIPERRARQKSNTSRSLSALATAVSANTAFWLDGPSKRERFILRPFPTAWQSERLD